MPDPHSQLLLYKLVMAVASGGQGGQIPAIQTKPKYVLERLGSFRYGEVCPSKIIICPEISGNCISGLLNFKPFWWSLPPDPSSDSRLRRSFSFPFHARIIFQARHFYRDVDRKYSASCTSYAFKQACHQHVNVAPMREVQQQVLLRSENRSSDRLGCSSEELASCPGLVDTNLVPSLVNPARPPPGNEVGLDG